MSLDLPTLLPSGFLEGSDSYSNVETVWNHKIFALLHILALGKLVGEVMCLQFPGRPEREGSAQLLKPSFDDLIL